MQKHEWSEEEVLAYVPERPGWFRDPTNQSVWLEVYGYSDVILENICVLANELWGEPSNRRKAPLYKDRAQRVKTGKWRTYKPPRTDCAPYWYMATMPESGHHIVTRGLSKRQRENEED